MSAKAASVRFEGVTKAFGKVEAVREVDFEIAAGSLVTLLGLSVGADTIQEREATIRERPSFLGRVVGYAG